MICCVPDNITVFSLALLFMVTYAILAEFLVTELANDTAVCHCTG
jgi:hypothetical protein